MGSGKPEPSRKEIPSSVGRVKARMQNFKEILEKTFIAEIEHHGSIDSTNDRAIQCGSLHGIRLPLLILADSQTAGRGRGSNRWWTGPGSLAFSLLLDAPRAGSNGPARQAAMISLAMGLAVVDALTPLVPGHEIGLHWPNDVMLDGRKLAGILVEVLADGKQVIGIGINTNNTAGDAPDTVRPRVITLRDASGRKHDFVEILVSVLGQIQKQLSELAVSPQRVAERTHALCRQRGARLKLVQGAMELEGRCLGIASDGALLVEINGTPQSIYSGVVKQVELFR
jgi:BirA family transcriptional regulator, biotin operon repressor / biotin---[acetyl-CoA-carboxylase] ligase